MNITTTILVPFKTFNAVVLHPDKVTRIEPPLYIPTIAAWDAVDPKLANEIMHAHSHGEFVKLQIMKP